MCQGRLNNSNLSVLEKLNLIIQSNRKPQSEGGGGYEPTESDQKCNIQLDFLIRFRWRAPRPQSARRHALSPFSLNVSVRRETLRHVSTKKRARARARKEKVRRSRSRYRNVSFSHAIARQRPRRYRTSVSVGSPPATRFVDTRNLGRSNK